MSEHEEPKAGEFKFILDPVGDVIPVVVPSNRSKDYIELSDVRMGAVLAEPGAGMSYLANFEALKRNAQQGSGESIED